MIDPRGLDDDEGITLLESFDPFTETPIEGVHWRKATGFGDAINENAFQTPQTFRFSVGVRF